MARRPRASDETLVELFLDMLAAERGASENTLAAYRRDLADLSAHLRAKAPHIAEAQRPTNCALSREAFQARLRRHRWRGGCPRSASSIVSSKRGPPRRRSGRGDRRARSAAARCRRCSRSARSNAAEPGAHAIARTSKQPLRTAARRAAEVPAGGALRDGPARLRTGGAAGRGGAARPAHAGHPRQGRQGAAGAAQRRGQARDDRLSRAARERTEARRQIEMAVSVVRREAAT